MPTLDEIEKQWLDQNKVTPTPAPVAEYTEEYTVTPTDYTREEKTRLREKRGEARGALGFPSVGRAMELGKEGSISGASGLATFPLTVNTLAAKGVAALLPIDPLKKMATSAASAEEAARGALEPRIRGLLSGTLEAVPNPMVPREGEVLPEMIPPETLAENVIYRGGEFFPEAFTAATATRALLGASAPGVLGAAAGGLRAIPGAAGASAGLGTVSVIGEEVGGILGRPLGAEEEGRVLGRISAELLGGVGTQAGGRAAIGAVSEAGRKVLAPLYRGSMDAARRVFDQRSLSALGPDAVAGMDRVQANLDQFFATREGQRLRQAMEGRQAASEDVVRAAEQAMADMGMPLTIDLATRTGTAEMRNLVQQLERKSEAMRSRKVQQEVALDEGAQRFMDQLYAGRRQLNLPHLSEETLSNIIQRQEAKIASYEQRMNELASQVRRDGASFESVGREARRLLAEERNATKILFQGEYQRLDNQGNAISAQLPGGGYRLDNILGYLERIRTQQPTLFDQVHSAITRYDRAGQRLVLKENPADSSDILPDSGDFPELMTPEELADPSLASADSITKKQRDEDAYKGTQEYPGGEIPVDVSKFQPVSFATLRHLRRDAGYALRSAPAQLRGPLLELQRLIDAEIAENTPELFDTFRALQQSYARQFIERYKRGIGGKILSADREGAFTTLDSSLLDMLWKAGADGAMQIRALGLDRMRPNPLLTVALRKLAKSVGTQDPSQAARKFAVFLEDNREFLEAAGLTPYFTSMRTSMEALNDSLRIAREESKIADRELLRKLIAGLEVPIGGKEDLGDVLRTMVANRSDRETLTRMMASPGMEDFRDAVLQTMMDGMRAAKSKTPFDDMVALQEVLRPLYATKSPEAFDKALAFAAIVQARRMTSPTAFPQGLESIAAQDPLQRTIGSSTVAVLGRARAVVMGYMSKFYAAFDVLSRYGIKLSRERADQLLMDAIYDPQAADRLLNLTFELDRPNISLGGVDRALRRWNQYAIENGLTVLLFEGTERTQPPEPLPQVD